MRGILKHNGYFVFTVPLSDNPMTIERCYIENGQIVHVLPPEYHGDHLRSKGILAFRNYGLDIVQRLESSGFKSVYITEHTEKGISKKVIHCIK
jgi:hypothetical protein